MWLFFFWMIPLLVIANCVVAVIFLKAAPLNASPFLVFQLKKFYETSISLLA
jgi:hypothetical protein